MQLISVSGGDYERGFSIGKQACGMIQSNVEYYERLWAEYSKLDKEWVVTQASRFVPEIERYDPAILEELRGIGDRAGLSLAEIVALNCRYEFVWAKMEVDAYMVSSPSSPECTAIGSQPRVDQVETAVVVAVLIGQNWDYKPSVRKNCILLEEIQEPARPNVVIHTEAGVVGQKGMNSAGLGLLVNALVSDRDRYEPCVPFLLAVREALNQRTACTRASQAQREQEERIGQPDAGAGPRGLRRRTDPHDG